MASPLRYLAENPEETVKSASVAPEVGSVYQRLIDSNPYRNVDYRMSPWQKILSKLGFRTQADAWKENMTVQANEYDAAIMQKIYDEDYNDPTSQVARMRAAGLNPDLDPSTIDSGEAAAPGEDPSTPMQSTGQEEVILQVANGCMAAFSDALGMIQSFQGINRNSLQNSILATEDEQKFTDWASQMSLQMLPSSAHPDGIENFDWKAASIQNAEKWANTHLSGKKAQKFIDYQKRFFESAVGQGESQDAFTKRIQSMRSAEYENDYFFSEIPSVLSLITDPLASMAEKIYSQRQTADLQQGLADEAAGKSTVAGAQTEIAYQTNLDGVLMAEAQNAANAKQAADNEILSILHGTVGEIVTGLKKAREDGGIKGAFAGLALGGIAMLQIWLSGVGAPSISRSQSSGSSAWSKSGGSASHSSGSFSIGF